MKFFGQPNGGHPNYHRNSEDRDGTLCCAYCGKLGKNKTFVFLNWDGTPCSPDTQGDVLGLYPIGSDCAKKAKAAGIKIYTWDMKEV